MECIPMIVGLAGIVKAPAETATTLLARDYKGFSTYGSNGVLYIKEANSKGYAEAYEGDGVNFGASGSTTRRGRVGRGEVNTLTTQAEQGVVVSIDEINANAKHQQDLVQGVDGDSRCIPAGTHGSTPHLLKTAVPCAIDEQNQNIRKDGTVGTLTTDGSSPKHNNRVLENNLRIRKLTPTECWRLQGFCYPLMDEDGIEYLRDENGKLIFDDSAIEKAKAAGVSASQLYKQAGNAVSVNISESIGIALKEWEDNQGEY